MSAYPTVTWSLGLFLVGVSVAAYVPHYGPIGRRRPILCTTNLEHFFTALAATFIAALVTNLPPVSACIAVLFGALGIQLRLGDYARYDAWIADVFGGVLAAVILLTWSIA